MNGATHLVVGPPGTGKTTYQARQAQRAAETHGADRVVIASLTRAAAAEIAGRDTGILGHLVGTLHRHCYHALELTGDWGAETREGVKAWNAAHPQQALSGGRLTSLEDAVDSGVADGSAARHSFLV